MADPKLRRAIAFEAARLMYDRSESEYFTAKSKAAKRLCRGPVKPGDLTLLYRARTVDDLQHLGDGGDAGVGGSGTDDRA